MQLASIIEHVSLRDVVEEEWWAPFEEAVRLLSGASRISFMNRHSLGRCAGDERAPRASGQPGPFFCNCYGWALRMPLGRGQPLVHVPPIPLMTDRLVGKAGD